MKRFFFVEETRLAGKPKIKIFMLLAVFNKEDKKNLNV